VQANDPNRRGPGQGELQFAPIVERLLAMRAAGHYDGIVAVEPFDYVPDGIGCAARAIGYLRGIVESLSATATGRQSDAGSSSRRKAGPGLDPGPGPTGLPQPAK
jgi:hypothetical protein